jgi:AraC family transcriptional regulator, transcriptional activator FtrA
MRHRVAILAYDGLCTFEFGCAVEVFALPRPEMGDAWYECVVCAAEPGPLRATGGIRVQATHGLRTLAQAQTIIVPGWRGIDVAPPPALLAALRRAHARGARIASICSGVFVLAAAGLLAGRRATTHWRYTQVLAARHPEIAVEPDALYVDAGQVLTSAGSAAGLDMMLHLVRRDHGGKAANLVAQRLVLPAHRVGDQAQFVPRPVPDDDAGRLARLIDWLRARPAQPHTIDTMAARAHMSRRTLQRQFAAAVGCSPLAWLLRERVGVAKDLLEAGRMPMASVGERAGFASEESFRRHFRRIAGVSPSAYRRQFARAR